MDINNELQTEAKYEEYYIAFLDILGFKNLLSKYPCSFIRSIFSYIQFVSDKYYSPNSQVKFDYFTIMSDSIVLSIRKDSNCALNRLISGCALLQSFLVQLDQPILIRGGISCGSFYFNDYSFFGPGLVKAYELENNAVYPRIIIDQCCLKNDNSTTVFRLFNTGLLRMDTDSKVYIDYFKIAITSSSTENSHGTFCTSLLSVIEKMNMEVERNESIWQKYLWINILLKKNLQSYIDSNKKTSTTFYYEEIVRRLL